MRRLFILLLVAAVVYVQASLDVDPRYSVTPFITNWGGVAGTFNTLGDYYFMDINGICLYKIAHTETGPFDFANPGVVSSHQVGCPVIGFSDIVATASNRLYTSSGYELNAATGAQSRRWTTFAHHGIALDPTDQSLVFVDYDNKKVYRVPNPDTSHSDVTAQVTLFLDTSLSPVSSGIDGITVGPDGTVYMSAYDSLKLVIAGRNPDGTVSTVTAVPLFDDGSAIHIQGSGPDGISICGDGSYAVTTRGNGQRLTYWNLTTLGPQQDIVNGTASDGVHWDWSSVGTDGCIYFSTELNIFKLGLNGGGCPCFSVQDAVSPCDSVTPAVAGGECQTASVTSSGTTAKLSFASDQATAPCTFRDATPIGG